MSEQKIDKLTAILSCSDISGKQALLGFDGFVDRVVHVVKSRLGHDQYSRETSLAEYGRRVAQASGFSSNVEIVPVSEKLGGNGPVLASSLLNFGVRISYIGALGEQVIDSVFASLVAELEDVYAISDPARTDAVEFHDGKLIRSDLTSFSSLTFERIVSCVGRDSLLEIFERSDLLGFVNWSLLYNSTDIWSSVLSDIVPFMQERVGKICFFDLADPHARSEQDIRAVLGIIKGYTEYFEVVLGMNLSEARRVTAAIGWSVTEDSGELSNLCSVVSEFLNGCCVVIHPIDSACCIDSGEYFFARGLYCDEPVLTTGAGDNFNAGFLAGRLLGIKSELSLILGMATSGFYVRNGRSGELAEIIGFLEDWRAELTESVEACR